MKKAVVPVVLLLCFLLNGCAVRAFKSKKFWIETGVIMAAATADGITTNQVLRQCPTCVEENPLLGQRPSTKRIFITGAAFHSAKRLIIAAVWQRKPKEGSILSTMDMVISSWAHAYYAHRNTTVCPAPDCLPKKP